MIKLRAVRQKPGFCGLVSLQMVLEYYGIKIRNTELNKLVGCRAAFGSKAWDLLKAAKKLGLGGFVDDFAEIDDLARYVLKDKIPVIVDWFSQDDGHYSVVVDIDKKYIYLQDPSIGKVRKMDLKIFKRVWFDFAGDFLKSKRDIIVRRVIVIFR